MVGGLQVQVFDRMDTVEDIWRVFEKNAISTYYQSFAWCSSWFGSIGKRMKVRPILVLGRDEHGDVVFILPLQMRNKFGSRLLEWLTQPENNYGCGIYTDKIAGSDWFDRNFLQLLAILPQHDILNLQNMPGGILDKANPLAGINRLRAANCSYVTALQTDFDALHHSKRTPKSISKIRRRDERLHELGKIDFELEPPGQAAQRRLVEVFNDKSQQLSELGIHGVFGPEERAFMLALETEKIAGVPCLQVYRLALDGKTLSTLVGGVSHSHFWLMVTALSPGAPRQFSPGDMLLRKTIELSCRDSISTFDFSNGEVGYKVMWADQEVLLYNHFASRTLRGLPLAAALMAYHAIKRTIKNQPLLRDSFNIARRILKGRKTI
jgi:CelD/BcsL family acetyltransferase involved in cellulose biosynthesis